MKVLQINSIYGEKSTGIVVRDIDLLLQQEKIDSYVAYRDTNSLIKNGFALGNVLDWKYHAFRTRIDGRQCYSSSLTTKNFIKKLEKICPDIIHLHNIHSNFLNLPILMKYIKSKKIPLIVTLHDCWIFTGKCFHFADIGCEKWKTRCEKCPKRYMDIPSKLKDSSLKVFQDRLQLLDYEKLYIVGCSEWITALAKQSPILKRGRFCTIYNGIDTTIFYPRQKTDKECSFTIVTMANKWFEKENENVRNRILDFLGDKGNILIIGCTSEQQQMYVYDKRVKAIGYIRDRKELASLYGQGDVFLNLTHVDNLPTVNMEALSCGIPVITYDAGGSGELVKDGKTGYIVDLDNIDEIILALHKIQQGNISRDECRKYAVQNFDKEKNYLKYIKLYHLIIDKMEENLNESNV